jgi:cytosine/adenosine deaminase-related metal-dependent hydrolase
MVFHIHVEEQPKEVRDCTTRYGRTPMALLCDRLKLDDRFTAVHCTHTTAEDLARYLAFGGRVCMIPLTEADLGDGIADVPSIIERGRLDRLCLGTDSNHRIAFNEEMRWLEYVQRLARQRRGVLVDDRGSNAAALWRIATENGAAALGVRAGRIAPGWTADFITLDLGAPSLAVWTPQTLLDAFIFGSGSEAIAARCIGGRWLPPSKAGSSPGTLRHDRAGA